MNSFGAMIHRMNYINRWGLMRSARTESLAEHAMCAAYMAHLLACIAKTYFGAAVDPEKTACYALYHDAGEILTGDLPTPVKYGNDAMRAEYKKVEQAAQQRLVSALPGELGALMEPVFTGEALSDRERDIVKAADRLCALIKCMEEEAAGNTEFKSAKESTLKRLRRDMLPETEYFLKEFIPAYPLTLDELMAL